jgi:hypothetical protein
MRSVLRLHKESIVRYELVRQLEASYFISGVAAEMCQPARTGAVGHGSRGRYVVRSRYQATQ